MVIGDKERQNLQIPYCERRSSCVFKVCKFIWRKTVSAPSSDTFKSKNLIAVLLGATLKPFGRRLAATGPADVLMALGDVQIKSISALTQTNDNPS